MYVIYVTGCQYEANRHHQCVNKDRECSYLPSKRGGPRKKKEKSSTSPERHQSQDVPYPAMPSPGFEECMCVDYCQTENQQINIVTPSNGILAGMFSQIDDLSLPGAGLRHLDFQAEVPSIFQGLFNSDGTQSHMQVPPISPSLMGTESYVRTYGSEPEMYVPVIQSQAIV